MNIETKKAIIKKELIAIVLLPIITVLAMIIYVRVAPKPEGVTDKTIGDLAITKFNSKYTQFAGSQRGQNVKTLIHEVITNNSVSNINVSIEYNYTSTVSNVQDIAKILGEIKSSATYYVEMLYQLEGPYKGYVEKIAIYEKK